MMKHFILHPQIVYGCALIAMLVPSMAHGGLNAHYTCDEAAGSTIAVNQVTANGANGAIGANVVMGVAGKVGTAMSKGDAATQADIIDMANATGIFSKITASGQFTLSYWLSTTDISNGRNVAVFMGDNTDNNAYIDSGIVGGTTTTPVPGSAYGRNRANTDTLIGEIIGPLINNGQFHHLALTVNTATMTGAFYLDGTLVFTEVAARYAALPNLNNLEIGRLGRSAPTDPLAGIVDDLQIYDTALSASDVNFLFANPGATVGVVPEPTSIGLLVGAAIGCAILARKRS